MNNDYPNITINESDEDIVFFIDKEGNKYYIEGLNSHIELARRILKSSKKLTEEFEKSNEINPVVFFIRKKEYVAGSEGKKGYENVTYDSEKMTEEQRKLVQIYIERGYFAYDLAEEKKHKMNRGEK